MIYWELMKVKQVIFLGLILVILGGRRYFPGRAAVGDGQGEFLIKALELTGGKSSVKAESLDWDQRGNLLATVSYVFDRDDWSMSVWDDRTENVRECLSCWTAVGGWLYIFDSRDGKHWKMPESNEISLNFRIDIRATAKVTADKINGRGLKIKSFGSEPCGGEICLRYEIDDPDDTELSHYLWIGQGTRLVRREQFLLGNGQTSITDYGNYDTAEVELPAKVKDAEPGVDPLMFSPG